MDADEAEKRKLLYEIEDELWKLLRRRAWIGVLIGAGGLWAAVNFAVREVADRPLQDVRNQLMKAEFLVERVGAAAAAASGVADQVKTQLASLTVSIQSLKDEAKGVEERFGVVRERISAEAKNAALRSEKDFSAVQQRIVALEALVKRFGEENEATRKATADYARKIAELESKIEKEQKRFAENSTYTIWISFIPDKKALALELQSRLASVGFKALFTPSLGMAIPPKGSSLNFVPQSEPKVQEVLALIRPVVKDIEARKLDAKSTKIKLPFEFSGSVFPSLEHREMFLNLGG
jgi:hypothetical protein